MGQEAHGLELRRSSAGYDVRDDKGTSVFTLPRFTGQAIAADPKRYGPRLQLLSEALALENPDALYDRAAALLHTIAEKEHDIADGTLAFGTAEARAGALVTWLKRRQSATTPEAQVEAENYIRAALFSEAAPGNRLASFGLDLAPIIANLRAAEDFTEDTKKAAKALNEGRYGDAAGASLWAVVDLVGAVTGFGAAGKGLKAAARQTKFGRKAFAARDLARMARDFHRTRNAAPARALVGEKVWKMLDEDQRGYLEGLYSNVKGQAAEGRLTDTLDDLGMDTAKVVERRAAAQNPEKPTRRNSILKSEMLEEHGGRTRVFDDAIDGFGLEKSLFGLFRTPKPIQGRQQKFEMKAADAQPSTKQKVEDGHLMDSPDDYGDIDVAHLALPYDKLPKKALREIAVGLMRNPKRAGQKYITTGRWKIVPPKDAHKYPVVRKFKGKDGKEKIVRQVKWQPEDLEMMIQQVDRSLRLQHFNDQAPTVIDFTLALFARLAIAGREPRAKHLIAATGLLGNLRQQNLLVFGGGLEVEGRDQRLIFIRSSIPN